MPGISCVVADPVASACVPYLRLRALSSISWSQVSRTVPCFDTLPPFLPLSLSLSQSLHPPLGCCCSLSALGHCAFCGLMRLAFHFLLLNPPCNSLVSLSSPALLCSLTGQLLKGHTDSWHWQSGLKAKELPVN